MPGKIDIKQRTKSESVAPKQQGAGEKVSERGRVETKGDRSWVETKGDRGRVETKGAVDVERMLRKRVMRKHNRERQNSSTVYYTRMLKTPDLGLQM